MYIMSFSIVLFQSTLPHGSDLLVRKNFLKNVISIHAPSRERLVVVMALASLLPFQSTLPHGSDEPAAQELQCFCYFNPRSLTGATASALSANYNLGISIHAPSRERQHRYQWAMDDMQFQSTLPHGSDSPSWRFLTAML